VKRKNQHAQESQIQGINVNCNNIEQKDGAKHHPFVLNALIYNRLLKLNVDIFCVFVSNFKFNIIKFNILMGATLDKSITFAPVPNS
jgi:hypothetical protein